MSATKSQARACYDNYFGTLRCYNGGTREENERSADGCREAVRPYVKEAARLAATAGKLLRADAWLMRALTEDIPANFAAFNRHYPEKIDVRFGMHEPPLMRELVSFKVARQTMWAKHEKPALWLHWFWKPEPRTGEECAYDCGYSGVREDHEKFATIKAKLEGAK